MVLRWSLLPLGPVGPAWRPEGGGVDVPGIESPGDVGDEVVGRIGVGMLGGVDVELSGGADDVLESAVDEAVTGAVGQVSEGCASEEGERTMAVVQRRRVPRRSTCRWLAGWIRRWRGRKRPRWKQPGGHAVRKFRRRRWRQTGGRDLRNRRRHSGGSEGENVAGRGVRETATAAQEVLAARAWPCTHTAKHLAHFAQRCRAALIRLSSSAQGPGAQIMRPKTPF